MIKKLLTLESVYGPLPGYQPALLDVMDYLESVSIKRFILHYYIRHASIDELGVLSKTSSPFDVTSYSYCILSS